MVEAEVREDFGLKEVSAVREVTVAEVAIDPTSMVTISTSISSGNPGRNVKYLQNDCRKEKSESLSI